MQQFRQNIATLKEEQIKGLKILVYFQLAMAKV